MPHWIAHADCRGSCSFYCERNSARPCSKRESSRNRSQVKSNGSFRSKLGSGATVRLGDDVATATQLVVDTSDADMGKEERKNLRPTRLERRCGRCLEAVSLLWKLCRFCDTESVGSVTQKALSLGSVVASVTQKASVPDAIKGKEKEGVDPGRYGMDGGKKWEHTLHRRPDIMTHSIGEDAPPRNAKEAMLPDREFAGRSMITGWLPQRLWPGEAGQKSASRCKVRNSAPRWPPPP